MSEYNYSFINPDTGRTRHTTEEKANYYREKGWTEVGEKTTAFIRQSYLDYGVVPEPEVSEKYAIESGDSKGVDKKDDPNIKLGLGFILLALIIGYMVVK